EPGPRRERGRWLAAWSAVEPVPQATGEQKQTAPRCQQSAADQPEGAGVRAVAGHRQHTLRRLRFRLLLVLVLVFVFVFVLVLVLVVVLALVFVLAVFVLALVFAVLLGQEADRHRVLVRSQGLLAACRREGGRD